MYNRALVLGLITIIELAGAYYINFGGIRYLVDPWLIRWGIIKYSGQAQTSDSDTDTVNLSNVS